MKCYNIFFFFFKLEFFFVSFYAFIKVTNLFNKCRCTKNANIMFVTNNFSFLFLFYFQSAADVVEEEAEALPHVSPRGTPSEQQTDVSSGDDLSQPLPRKIQVKRKRQSSPTMPPSPPPRGPTPAPDSAPVPSDPAVPGSSQEDALSTVSIITPKKNFFVCYFI